MYILDQEGFCSFLGWKILLVIYTEILMVKSFYISIIIQSVTGLILLRSNISSLRIRFLRGKFHRGEYYCKINVSKKARVN